jgi:2-aminoethylphosphonate-pyruvate transaminase
MKTCFKGPLTTSLRVKLPTLVDWGSREKDFAELITNLKSDLLHLTVPSDPKGFEVVLMQGSGTFGVESAVGSAIPKIGSKLLVIINGTYGMRMAKMASMLDINMTKLIFNEDEIPDENAIADALDIDQEITHVGIIHSETTTGILNPIERIAPIVKSRNKVLIVDCMSSFGAIPFDVNQLGIDFAIGSANKGFQASCIFYLCKN